MSSTKTTSKVLALKPEVQLSTVLQLITSRLLLHLSSQKKKKKIKLTIRPFTEAEVLYLLGAGGVIEYFLYKLLVS